MGETQARYETSEAFSVIKIWLEELKDLFKINKSLKFKKVTEAPLELC